MLSKNLVEQVANLAGVISTYHDAWGEPIEISYQNKLNVLTTLGLDTHSDSSLLSSLSKRFNSTIFQPIYIFNGDAPHHVAIGINELIHPKDQYQLNITLEDGEVHQLPLSASLFTHEDEPALRIPTLPLGYHQLTLSHQDKAVASCQLVFAPRRCYQQSPLEQGKKVWGVSVQLYALRSEANWGIGDFSDLGQLVSDMADLGADYVGINPIHQLFINQPESASPYSPSSRLWLNPLYIDVGAVSEFALSQQAQERVGEDSFQQTLASLRASPFVDYSGVSQIKMQVLALLFAEFNQRHLATHSNRAQLFHQFVAQGGQSLQFCAYFDALCHHFSQPETPCRGWYDFPAAYQDPKSEAVAQFAQQHQEAINFHLYLQWICAQQIEQVQQLAIKQNMTIGLYRDLAVGASSDGAQLWSERELFCTDASIGAPPDPLGPLGQDWGLPPYSPDALIQSGYRPFIELLRSNMKSCGALRIDHILGLLRLWWVPNGQSAQHGAYIRYPIDDLLNILALESHRHQCAIIGEDLGTIPPAITTKLQQAGIFSYKVFFFETAEDGGFISPQLYPAQSMATLCTHDMATLKGFWQGSDLILGQELGLYPDNEKLNQLFQGREHGRQQIINSVSWHGFIEQNYPASPESMNERLALALHSHLAAGTSTLFSIQLEDLLLMETPVNVPGTTTQYPNWRRKLSLNLDEIVRSDFTQKCAHAINRQREMASHANQVN